MAEEKKEVREEAKRVAKEKKQVPEKEAKAAAEKKEEAPSEPKKKKKINKLTFEQVEEKLKSVEVTMGGTSSKYAQHLLQRREELLQKKRVKEIK